MWGVGQMQMCVNCDWPCPLVLALSWRQDGWHTVRNVKCRRVVIVFGKEFMAIWIAEFEGLESKLPRFWRRRVPVHSPAFLPWCIFCHFPLSCCNLEVSKLDMGKRQRSLCVLGCKYKLGTCCGCIVSVHDLWQERALCPQSWGARSVLWWSGDTLVVSERFISPWQELKGFLITVRQCGRDTP